MRGSQLSRQNFSFNFGNAESRVILVFLLQRLICYESSANMGEIVFIRPLSEVCFFNNLGKIDEICAYDV